MKQINLLKLLYIVLILLIALFKSNSQTNGIYYIIDATLNGTGAYVDLESYEGDYAYFSYDFNFHSASVKEDKEIAYFALDIDEFNLDDNKKISYGFVEKNWTDIKAEEIKNINWKEINFLNKNKTIDEKTYYYRILRDNKEMNTLLFRIPIYGNKKGTIYFSNILGLLETYDDFDHFRNNAKDLKVMYSFYLLLIILFLL